MMPLLHFDDVSFAYGPAAGHGPAENSRQAAPAPAEAPGLARVSLAVQPGDFVMLTGPSGSGKSTLLRLAVRLEEAQSGVIRCAGRPVADMAPAELRRMLGFVQQTPTVGAGTVRDNLLLPFSFAANRERTPPGDRELAEWLERFRLAGPGLDAVAASLSVGQRQRLCIIRTMLLRPAALLMDEPTSALDGESSAVVEELTEELNADGVTVLMVTHGAYRPARRPWRLVRVENGAVRELSASVDAHPAGEAELPGEARRADVPDKPDRPGMADAEGA